MSAEAPERWAFDGLVLSNKARTDCINYNVKTSSLGYVSLGVWCYPIL
jgi:hypothetical protein